MGSVLFKMTVWLKDLETTQTKPSITSTRTCEHTCIDAEKINIKIKLDKCKFLTEEVTYVGYTNAGLNPDEEKVRVITEFPATHDLRVIGIVKFGHSLTTKREPLNRFFNEQRCNKEHLKT